MFKSNEEVKAQSGGLLYTKLGTRSIQSVEKLTKEKKKQTMWIEN